MMTNDIDDIYKQEEDQLAEATGVDRDYIKRAKMPHGQLVEQYNRIGIANRTEGRLMKPALVVCAASLLAVSIAPGELKLLAGLLAVASAAFALCARGAARGIKKDVAGEIQTAIEKEQAFQALKNGVSPRAP